MLLLLYTLTAALVLFLLHRFVCTLSKVAAIFLFLLAFAFVGHALVAGRVYAPIDKTYMSVPLSEVKLQHGIGAPHNPVTADIFSQMIPWRHVVRESYARGEWPLWNPYILSGDILAAAAQPAAYSPFTFVALLLPAALSFTLTAALTFLLAAATAFAFARDLGCRESAAAIAAAGWAYSTAIALYVLWPLGMSWALMPFVLLATRRVVRNADVKSWGLLTTALALLILAGHPQSVMHIVVLSAIYGLVERPRLRAIATAVAAGITALLICAIQLLPNLEAVPQTAEYSFRQMWRAAPRGDTTQQVLASLATDVFPFLHLRNWLDPAVAGLKAESPAVGSIVLALAIYAVWRARGRAAFFFAALALFGTAVHSAWKPLAQLLQKLPLFDITINERLAFAAALALALLAALGAEEIAKRGDRKAAVMVLVNVLVALGAGTWWIQTNFELSDGPRDWGEYTIFAELALLAAAIVALVARAPIGTLVALLLIQRTLSEGGVHKSFAADAAYPEMKIFEPLRKTKEPFRITGEGGAMIPGTNALYGFEDIRGYEAMTLRSYALTYPAWCVFQPAFFNRIDDLGRPMLSMMNVRYAFTTTWGAIPTGWREVAREKNALLLENPNAIERAFLPRHVTIGTSDEQAVEAMKQAADFRERAWISADVAPYERANGPGRITRIQRTKGRGYELAADMQADGWIVVSESAWKGWRAYVDGQPRKVQRANVGFLAVHVERGRHTIRLAYWPRSFVIGRAISFATLFAVGLFALWRLRFARCEKSPASSSSSS